MWIMTKDGFFSVVQKGCPDGDVCVRARSKEHLETLLNKVDHMAHLRGIVESEETDYRFRTWLSKKEFATYMKGEINAIDYDNFKNTIDTKTHEGRARYTAFTEIWEIMYHYGYLINNKIRK